MDPPITSAGLTRAVALLISQKSTESAALNDAKSTNLRELYGMIRSVVKGNQMRDVAAPGDDDGEAWEMFRNDVKWQEGKVDIVLPEFEDVLKGSQEDEEQVDQTILIDSPAPAPTYTPIPIPAISTTQRAVYTPRLAATQDRPKWINGLPNPAAYEPPLDPRVFPLPATGHATQLAFEPPVETQDVIPLESTYAANLHPLPHLQQRHRQKRDRIRSDAGTVKPGEAADNPGFGGWSFGVPPAYVTPSTRRQKVEAFQASRDPMLAEASTVNPVLTNPSEATSSFTAGENMEGKTLVNPIASTTLVPATKDVHAGKGRVDLYELGIGFRVNPVSRGMKKTNKCLTSRDWSTAYEEVKYLRSLERIEKLKEDNAWSFRQMKRFRGPVMGKVHWDYVLDEMRWLATDFKEERKWKLTAAYEMAGWCRDFHLASPDERAGMSVGGRRWGAQKPVARELVVKVDTDADGDVPMDEDQPVDEVVRALAEREEEVAAVEKELGRETVPLGAFGKPVDTGDGGDDVDAEGEEDDGEDAVGEVDMDALEPEPEAQPMDVDSATHISGLKAEGGDQTLGAENQPEASDDARRAFEARVPMLRKPILDVDRTTLGVDVAAILEQAALQDDPVELPDSLGLVDIFPDLAVFGAPSAPVSGKIEKRLDETGANSRMAHVSRLFDVRPVMLTSLNPSRNRAADGRWVDAVGPMYDVVEDLNDPVVEDQVSLDIFRAHKGKSGGDGKIAEPEAPKYPDQRLAALVWEEQDDEVLLRAAKDYDYNWRLIADVVNSARVYVSTEKRTPWDCFDRWAVKIGYPSKRLHALAAANAAAATNTASQSNGEPSATPGANFAVPGAVNPSISGLKAEDGQNEGPMSPGGSIRKDFSQAKPAKTTKYEGSKKKVRATVLRDSIRRIQKRREANKAKQNVGRAVVIVHESHLPYLEKRGVLSPQELGEMAYQQMVQRAEQARQLQQQQARMRQLSAQQQAGSVPPGSAGNAPGPAGQMIPGQTQPIRPMPAPSTPGGTPQMGFTPAQQQMMVQAMQQQQQQQQQNAPQGGMPRPPMNQNLAALQNAHRAGLVQANNMRLQMPQNPAAAAAAAAQMAQRASQSPATSAAQVQNPNMRPPPAGTQNSPRPMNPGIPQQRPPMAGATQGAAPRPNANAALSSSVGQHLMNLMREAGISSMNQIPVPEHPSGGQWTAEQIKMYRMSQLQQWANPAIQTGNNGSNGNQGNANGAANGNSQS